MTAFVTRDFRPAQKLQVYSKEIKTLLTFEGAITKG